VCLHPNTYLLTDNLDRTEGGLGRKKATSKISNAVTVHFKRITVSKRGFDGFALLNARLKNSVDGLCHLLQELYFEIICGS
jgi:hypothetical protein